MPTIITDAFLNGLIALGASFAGAWAALKFQERHEEKKRFRAKKETGTLIYLMLSEQLTVLDSLKIKKQDDILNDRWFSAIARLSDKTSSITFDTKLLQEFLPSISSGLFRDIVIAQNRFLVATGHLQTIVEGDVQPAFESLLKIETELDHSIILMNSVIGDFGDFMNNVYSTKFPKSNMSMILDGAHDSLTSGSPNH